MNGGIGFYNCVADFYRSRRPNGATQTFRRPSAPLNPTSQSHQRDTSTNDINGPLSNTGTYVPPHISASRNGPIVDTRYSRKDLLDIYRELRDSRGLDDGLADLYVGDTDFETGPGNSLDGLNGSEACLNPDSPVEPVALHDMTEEELEVSLAYNRGWQI